MSKIMLSVCQSTVIAMAVLLLIAGCAKLKPETSTSQSPPTGALSAASQAASPQAAHEAGSDLPDTDKSKVVATIGDMTITLGELERRLKSQPSYVQVRFLTLDKKKEFLDDLVHFELLASAAIAKGYEHDPDVIFGMKQRMIKKLVETDLSQLVSMTDISDEELKAYYDANPTQFHKPEQVRVSEIITNIEPAAKSVRNTLMTRINENPRKSRQIFTELLRKHTRDEESAKVTGDI